MLIHSSTHHDDDGDSDDHDADDGDDDDDDGGDEGGDDDYDDDDDDDDDDADDDDFLSACCVVSRGCARTKTVTKESPRRKCTWLSRIHDHGYSRSTSRLFSLNCVEAAHWKTGSSGDKSVFSGSNNAGHRR